MKIMKNAEVSESSQMIYHSKGLGKSFPKMFVLLKSSASIKNYHHFSIIFLFLNDLLPNMIMSRDTDSSFWKFVIMTRFPIKFQENLPNLVLLLLSEQEL